MSHNRKKNIRKTLEGHSLIATDDTRHDEILNAARSDSINKTNAAIDGSIPDRISAHDSILNMTDNRENDPIEAVTEEAAIAAKNKSSK